MKANPTYMVIAVILKDINQFNLGIMINNTIIIRVNVQISFTFKQSD